MVAQMRRQLRLQSCSLSVALVVASLVASGKLLAFVHNTLSFAENARTVYKGYRFPGRTAAAQVGPDMNVDLQLRQDLDDLKMKFKQNPTMSTVKELEKAWNPALGSVWALSDLRGEWVMHNPSTSSLGWASGDAFRVILNLYQGTLGKMLNMELSSDPKLSIAKDGKTELTVGLRWGVSHDRVVLRSRLSVLKPNKLQDKPRDVHSAALKMTLPSMQQARALRVTYYDGEIMILRDDKDVLDVFWNADSLHARPPSKHQPEEAVLKAEVALGEQVGNLTDKVHMLKENLEEQQAQAKEDREERARLQVEVARLEKEVELASVDERAHAVKLYVMDKLKRVLDETTDEYDQKRSVEDAATAQLTAETTSLKKQAAQTREQLEQSHEQEASLREQIQLLKEQMRKGTRKEKENYRTALGSANSELSEVRQQLANSKKMASSLRHELERKQQELQKSGKTAQKEAMKREELEAQLAERNQEISEQNQKLSEAAAARNAVTEELSDASAQLEDLELKERTSRQQATAVETELARMIEEAKEVQHLGKQLQEPLDAHDKPWWKLFR